MQNNDKIRRDDATLDNYERLQKQFEELQQKYEQLLQATDTAQTVPASVAELSLNRTGTEPVVAANVDAPSNDILSDAPFDSLDSDEGYFNQISDEDRECFDGDFDGAFDAVEQSLSLNAQIKEEVYDFDAPICLDSSVLENHPGKEYSNPPVAVDGDDEIIDNINLHEPNALISKHDEVNCSPSSNSFSLTELVDGSAKNYENEFAVSDATGSSAGLNRFAAFRYCPVCKKEICKRALDNGHVLVCGKPCRLCQRTYVHKKGFHYHAINTHGTDEWESLLPTSENSTKSGERLCPECNVSFDKETFASHITVCGKKCLICGKTFPHPNKFRLHAIFGHGIENWKSLLPSIRDGAEQTAPSKRSLFSSGKVSSPKENASSEGSEMETVSKEVMPTSTDPPSMSENSSENAPSVNTIGEKNRHRCRLCNKRSYSDDSTLRAHVNVCGKRCKLCHFTCAVSPSFRVHALRYHKEIEWKSLLEPLGEEQTFKAPTYKQLMMSAHAGGRSNNSNSFHEKLPSPETITPISQPGFQHNTVDINEQTSKSPTYRQAITFAHEKLPSSEVSTLSFQPGSPDDTAAGDEIELSEIDAEKGKIIPPNGEDEITHLNKNTCKLCGKSYQRVRSYSDHVLVCGKVCSICNKHYAQASVFQHHAIRDHKRIDWKSLLLPVSQDQLTHQRSSCRVNTAPCAVEDESIYNHPAPLEHDQAAKGDNSAAIGDIPSTVDKTSASNDADQTAPDAEPDAIDDYPTIGDVRTNTTALKEKSDTLKIEVSDPKSNDLPVDQSCHRCKRSYKYTKDLKTHMKICGKWCGVCFKTVKSKTGFVHHALSIHGIEDWKSILKPSSVLPDSSSLDVKPVIVSKRPGCLKEMLISIITHSSFSIDADFISTPEFQPKVMLKRLTSKATEVKLEAPSPAPTPVPILKKIQFKCSKCPSVFERYAKYRLHLRDHYRHLFCNVCDTKRRLLSERALEVHKCWHANIVEYKHCCNADSDDLHSDVDFKSYACSICGKLEGTRGELKKHVASHASDLFQCFICKVTLKTYQAGKSHVSSQHVNGVSYSCPKCAKVFKSRSSVTYHLKTHHFKRKEVYKCSVCPRSFKFNSYLTVHKKSHERENERIESFKKRVGTKGKGYKCSRCSRVLKTPEGLRRHELTHNVDFKISCEMCSMTFLSKERYYKHKAGVHAPKKTLVCTICGKTYTETAGFRYHMAHHENKRLHKCLVCGKGFNRKGHLKHHAWSHNVGRTFPCDICGKLYKSEHSMYCHRRNSHHDNTFKCEICGKEFKVKHLRNRHQLMHAIRDAKKAQNLVNNTSAIIVGKNSASLDQFDIAASDQRTCPFCHKVFKAKHTFKGHLKLCGKWCRLCHKRIEHPHHFRSHALKKHEVTDWESLLQPCQQGELSNSDKSNGEVTEGEKTIGAD